MLFNSWQFAVFLPVVFAIYWFLPHRFRWGVLLISSYYFYMSWNAKYVILLLFTTAVSYFTALLMERKDTSEKKKRVLLLATLIACLGILFIFKYYNFACQSAVGVLNLFAIRLHPMTLKLILPVGISFYTFQTLGYVIDVYRGDVKAERHFGKSGYPFASAAEFFCTFKLFESLFDVPVWPLQGRILEPLRHHFWRKGRNFVKFIAD